MIILGIETSCDETALALIETRGPDFECRVIDSLIHSQADLHSAYGGVFPALAKREHGKMLVPLLMKLLADFPGHANNSQTTSTLDTFRTDLQAQNPELLESIEANLSFFEKIPQIDRIAVTEGPGLEPALWVGIIFSRILGALWNVPIIPVNHMEGHIVGSLLDSDKPTRAWQKLKPVHMPALAFLISGGHTELVKITGNVIVQAPNASGSQPAQRLTHQKVPAPDQLHYQIIGQTRDDAVGEAFDKAARLLGLSYPGGPHLSRLAQQAREENISSTVKLPRPMIKSDDLSFSFSGLKTAVLYAIRAEPQPLTESFKKGLAREFEDAVKDTLTAKLRSAIELIGAKTVIIGGGVSANTLLRTSFQAIADEYDIPLYLPSHHISGDNALMIALAGALDANAHAKNGRIDRPLKAHGTKRLGV